MMRMRATTAEIRPIVVSEVECSSGEVVGESLSEFEDMMNSTAGV